MPWNEVDLVKQRTQLIEALLLPGVNVTETCRVYGVTTKTAYKWLKRHKEGGYAALKNQSRARKHQAKKTAKTLEEVIVATHHEFPYWGPDKLWHVLRNRGTSSLPSPTTVGRILARRGCEVIKNNKSQPATIRFERETPNELWQMDFKGSFMTKIHRCYPLTIIDDCSRYSIELHACLNEQSQTVKARLTQCFKAFGMPKQINTDNGNPWGNSQLNGVTSLAVWLIKLGVRLSHSAPYHPQTNGKAERFHRTLKLEVLHDRQYKNCSDIQTSFDSWRHTYNYQRPHCALQGLPPCSRYQLSPRQYTDELLAPEYEKDDIVRKVHSQTGMFRFNGKRYRAGKGLGGEYIAIKETKDPGVFSIYFMDHWIKKINLEEDFQ